MLSKFKFIPTIPVEDLNRAKEFYTKKLGLKIDSEPIDGLCNLKNDKGQKFQIFERERTKADNAVLTFMVEDVEETVDELNKNNVAMEQYDFGNDWKTDKKGIMDMGKSGKVAWFIDTEGNVLRIEGK